MISKWGRFAVAAAGCSAPAAALAERYNLQAPESVIAREIYDLHTLIFLICCVIFVVVAIIWLIPDRRIEHALAKGNAPAGE